LLGGMYFLTVRGETRMPSLTKSSFAILSSPQVTFSTDIRWISSCVLAKWPDALGPGISISKKAEILFGAIQ
jgi:hypothetical protein